MWRLELTKVKWLARKQLKPGTLWPLCIPSSVLFSLCPQLQSWNTDKLHQTGREPWGDTVISYPTVASVAFLQEHTSNFMLGTSMEWGSYHNFPFQPTSEHIYPVPWTVVSSLPSFSPTTSVVIGGMIHLTPWPPRSLTSSPPLILSFPLRGCMLDLVITSNSPLEAPHFLITSSSLSSLQPLMFPPQQIFDLNKAHNSLALSFLTSFLTLLRLNVTSLKILPHKYH